MGLLNKSFRDIKKDFSTGQGWSNSLFKTTITQNDFQNLQKFNSAINNTNDGLTKSQRITKAWNANMTGCSIAAKRMGNDLVTGKKTIKDISAAMNNASTSTKALGVAMNVLANVGLMLAITAVTKVISELSQAQEKAVQMAKEATESYKEEISSISDYKTRLSDLHKELNSGNLSYEETKTKRSELMSIQDELIKKFGTEKTAIEAVTKAIDGQVNSLDTLNEKSYREWVAKADEQSFWNKLLPGGKSGLDQAVDYMESDQTISFFDMSNANSKVTGQYADLNAVISDEVRAIQEEIDKTIQSKYNLEKEFATFKLTGTPDEIKAQLEAIRQDYIDLSKDAFLDNGISSEYWEAYRSEAIDSINEVINKLDDGLTKHQDTYKTYIEGMIKYDSEYSDEYANILQKRAELESAQNSGNKEEIQKARQSFMDAVSQGIEASGTNENIKKYFETLYPELQAEFASWNFEFSLNANTDGIKDIATQIGEKYTATNLFDMINTEGVQEGEDSFNKLIDKAIEYGICTDNSAEEVQKLIDRLVELGIVQGEVSSENADKMTVSLEDLTSASEGISTLQKAFKELSDEGYITTESISKIQEATKLSGEEWNSYQSKLLNAKTGTAEFNQVMTDLTYKILDNTFAGKDLTEVTEEQIAAVLRENGVTNASAVAHDYATRAKIHAKLATFDFSNATKEEIETLYEEMRTMGLTEGAIQSLSSAYASAQTAMLEAVSSGAIARLGVLQSELEGVKSLAEAYALLAGSGGYDSNNDGTVDYVGSEKSRMSGDTKTKYLADREKVLAYGRAVEALENIKSINIAGADVVPKYSGGKSGSGGGSGSAKNEALDNYLKDAENRYKVHQDETKYINDLNYALNNLVKTEDERLDVTGKINEAYRDLADNRIKDLEHQIDLTKELKGENADVTAQYNEIQRVAHEEAERLRTMGYDDNSNEIQDLQKTWWDAQNSKLDWRWNNSTNWIEERKTKGDWSLFGDSEVQAWERVIKWLEQDYPNALDKIKEAKNNLVDARWEHSNNWIDERNTYNDWALFNDSEVDAWERVVKWLKKDYPDDINKIKEAEQNLFEARKEQFNKANDFGSSILDSRKTFLQSYYDVTNSIAEAQHEINKELETSKTMYEWLDKDTRQLLFNQEDYNTLSEELLDIQYKADKLRWQYERDLNNSTLETVESITSQYEMQYETLMKSYEIAKADLEIAKKKQKLNNVLNERNVRMFINGQWQWVANTEDVINAKSELADAEYAKQVEEAGLTQQESINNLTKQQDELSVVIKKFENGVITLDEAVDAARNAIGKLPSALSSMYNNASSGGTSKSPGKVSYLHPSVVGSKSSIKVKEKLADGTRYTSGGMTLMGEEDFEAYISSNGHLIPINQPTIGNIPSGGIVFNTDQMKNLRSLWDLSNFNINPDRSYVNRQPQQIDQSQDNRIIINGMTVDSGSSDGQALIDALRRYVGNH